MGPVIIIRIADYLQGRRDLVIDQSLFGASVLANPYMTEILKVTNHGQI